MLIPPKKILPLIEGKLRKKIILIFFLTSIGTFLETLGIGIILPSLNIIVEGKSGLQNILSKFDFLNFNFNYLVKLSNSEIIIFCLLVLLSIFFIKAIFFIYLHWQTNKFSNEIDFELSKKFFKLYLSQEYTFHITRNSAELIRNVTDEVRTFSVNVVNPLLTIIVESFVLIALSILILSVQPVAAILVGIIVAVCSVAYIKFVKKQITNIGKDRQIHDALKIQHLKQGLNGIKEIKITGNEKEFLSIFNRHNFQSLKTRTVIHFLLQIPRFILEFIGVLALTLFGIILVVQSIDLKEFLPTFGLFAAAAFRLLPSANRIIQSINAMRFGKPAVELLNRELNYLEKNKVKIENVEEEKNLHFNKITFNKVSYKYPNTEKNVLKNVSFEINEGESVGIVGESGSGKSTLVDLITGLISTSSGTIKFDENLLVSNKRNWQKNIGYVPQFIFLTDDTILKNIAFGIEEKKIKISSIKNSLKNSQLKNFVDSLTNGLNTVVGESGVRLSGGQRQRIGIARALYFEPKLLVLDEATSSLDLETEKKIMDDINYLKRNKTLIIVSHRQSTISQCDRIFEIKNGNIFETN